MHTTKENTSSARTPWLNASRVSHGVDHRLDSGM